MPFFDNTRKPTGFGGKVMVAADESGPSGAGGLGAFLRAGGLPKALDCGCGGGANLKKLLKRCPGCHRHRSGLFRRQRGKIPKGEPPCHRSRAAASGGACQCSDAALCRRRSFDLVTAFETVYFWPDLLACFREIWRLLMPGGSVPDLQRMRRQRSGGAMGKNGSAA